MNNSLKYVKILESTGVNREEAEAHVQLITEIMEDNLATKQDLRNLETKFDTSINRLDNKIDSTFARLDNKIDLTAERLEHKMIQMESRLVFRLGTLTTVIVTIATTVLGFVLKT